MSPRVSRRDQIVDAALVSFLEHGLAGASIDDVRSRSGASVGSIYHHFGGREALAGAVYLAALIDFQSVFLAALTEHDGSDDAAARDGVRAAVAAHLQWSLRDRPEFARFLLFCGDAARASAPSELDTRNREFFGAVIAWWRPHVRRGVVQDLPLDAVHALWLGPAQEYARLHLSGRVRTNRPIDGTADARETALIDGAWHALASPRRTDTGRS